MCDAVPGAGARADCPATLAEAIRWLTPQLAAAGIESAARDTRRLVAAAAGVPATVLISDPRRSLAGDARVRLASFAARRITREPVSRILGTRDFYGREFCVSPATLDPRADSETLIAAALELAPRIGLTDRALRILDVGTGTGCLLLTLLAELPEATGVGTDVSADTLAVAQDNAARLGLEGRAAFRQARSLSGIAGPFDLLVANPPYIPSAEIAGLDPEVRVFDPLLALDGGPDGLDVYRELAGDLGRVVPNGGVIFEVGAGQAGAVREIVAQQAAAFCPQPDRFDLEGHARCVIFTADR